MSMYTCIHIHKCVLCVSIYTCLYVYIHIYMYIHTYACTVNGELYAVISESKTLCTKIHLFLLILKLRINSLNA